MKNQTYNVNFSVEGEPNTFSLSFESMTPLSGKHLDNVANEWVKDCVENQLGKAENTPYHINCISKS
jgi:hypothetical protein